ncbi:MAG: diguanylate cyclase [Nitrosospira sp.]|nr:diguanylate cyclase [Nitrosospira sp.]
MSKQKAEAIQLSENEKLMDARMDKTRDVPASQTASVIGATVLFVDDDPNILASLKRLFRPFGYRVLTAEGGVQGLKILDRESVDLVISNMLMPEMNGAQFLEKVRAKWPETVRMLLSGYTEINATIEAINKGQIYRYICKPWEENDITLAVKHALQQKMLEREKQRLEALTHRQNEELKELNANLHASEKKFRAIFESSADAIMLLTDKSFLDCNYSALAMFGVATKQEFIASHLSVLSPPFQPDGRDSLLTAHENIMAAYAQGQKHFEWVHRRKNGEDFAAEVLLSTFDYGGKKVLQATVRDITERKVAEERMIYMAQFDALTDLPNRALFTGRLQQALATAKRDKKYLALMFLDLDKFKPINDIFGHAVGDLLLKEAAKRMQECMRESDIVARIGGDEFIALLPNIEQEQDATMVAEKIRHVLSQPFELAGHSMHISSSIGIAVYPEHGRDEKTLMKNADIAMYHAKKNGRNNVILHHSGMLDAGQHSGGDKVVS